MKLEVFDINGNGTGREVDLQDDIFNLELNDNHEHVVYLAVKQYLAHQRQGTHKAKERGEIKGSTRKLHRQKGTGGSRKGDIKNPIFRGGGRVFGPRPRTYRLKLNKKVSRLARKAALSNKSKENKIIVVEDFNFEQPKTKQYVSFLNNFSAGEEGTLNDVKTLLMLSVPRVPEMPKEPRKQVARGRKKVLKNDYKEQYETAVAEYKTAKEAYDKALAEHNEKLEGTYKNIEISSRNIPNADVIIAKDLNTYEVMNADYIIVTESAVGMIQDVLGK